MRIPCEHRRKRIVPGQVRGKPLVEWCRDCGACRFGFMNDAARWVLPGHKRERSSKRPASPQLRLVGVDDVPCPDCVGGEVLFDDNVGVTCGFCNGSGMVPEAVARELRFAKGSIDGSKPTT